MQPTCERGRSRPTRSATTEQRLEYRSRPVQGSWSRYSNGVQSDLPRSRGSGDRSPDPEGGEPQMRPYETMVIFDTAADEAAVNGVLERALGALQARDGKPGRVDRWGKRTFAYEVQHKREGYYVVIEFIAEPAAVADMERVFVLADEVLRHKVMRLPDKVAGRRAASASSGGG
ncbi:MAG: 30S ribosomal protein S6 [Acidimicrobiales bacterium]